MAERVTRHAGITEPKEWRYLLCGIDTLDLGFYVNWRRVWPEILGSLEHRKGVAQQHGQAIWRESALGTCIVWPNGKKPSYKYHVQLPDYHLFIEARDHATRSPNVYVSISAKLLWSAGAEEAVEQLKQLISELGGMVERVQVSRCDLAADFYVPEPLTLEFLRARRVSQSKKTYHIENKGELETFYVGKKTAPIQARIYNKALEVRQGGEKLWFVRMWGLERCEHVWRVEFQLRRPALKQYGVDSLADLRAKAGGVWNDLTTRWLSFRDANDSNTTRRSVHPWWQAVSGCAAHLGPSTTAERFLDRAQVMPAEWYVSHISGCLVGLAARLQVPDISEALLELRQRVRHYWESRGWHDAYAKKAVQLGNTPGAEGVSDEPI